MSHADEIDISVENVGGIDESSLCLSAGVNALVGRNATNRTSFLQALMAVCGSDDVSLKSDADEGFVEMEIEGRTYTRSLARTGTGIQFDGDPLLESTNVADLFAFLLESNEARRAVAQGEPLRDIIMVPVDTEEINAEIDRLEAEKRDLDQRLTELADLEDELPDLEAERQTLESRLESKTEELEAKRAEIEALDTDVDESRQEKSERESKLDELREARSDLEDVRYDLETQRESLDSLREQRDEIQAQLDELSETPAGRLDEIGGEIDRLRREKRGIESDINEIQNVIQFNESRLEETDAEMIAALDGGTDAGSNDAVTDQLLEDETTTCWTCGSEVETDQIEATVSRLRELSQRKLGDISDIEDQLDDLEAEKRTLEDQRRDRERLERNLRETERRIEETESNIETLEEREQSLRADVDGLEDEVSELESPDHGEILDLEREATQLEFEVDRVQTDLDAVEAEMEDIRERVSDREELEAERERLQTTLTDLRTRIDRLEEEAVTAFNENMATVLNLLGYGNIDRIWIERTEETVRQGRRKVQETAFDIHVVRSSASGTAYEDTVDNLSESEREVTGLVFALAGYLTHDVHEECPFILLDSLEAIDSDRIASLVDYFAEKAPYLVVALLPEDAANLDSEHRRIESV
jgi:chromosome segregation ATPase